MSSVKLLVLGAFARRNRAHGYRIYRDLLDWHVDTWTNVKPGSIYHAFSQLEKQRIIKSKKAVGAKLGPARAEYILTEKGYTEFISLLESALKSNDFIELSAGIAFMEMLSRERVLTLLKERLNAVRAIPPFLKTLPTESIPSEPSKHPELINVWIDYFDSAIITTEKLIKVIEAGKYIFKNEK